MQNQTTDETIPTKEDGRQRQLAKLIIPHRHGFEFGDQSSQLKDRFTIFRVKNQLGCPNKQ